MRRLPVVLLVALLTSGCSTAAVSSPSPIPTAPPSLEPVASLSEPTTVPSPPAVGSPGCPTESPMSVATYKAADPACFRANDVTLTGWETIPSGIGGQSDHSTEPAWLGEDFTPDVLVDQLPEACSQEMCDPFLFVHVDPASKLEFERDGLYVVITGHVDDPISATCYQVFNNTPPASPKPDAAGQAECRARFVLTSVHEVPPPAGALSFCPTEPILTIYAARANAACFHGKALRVVGWLDKLPAIDSDGPAIAPDWLNFPTATLPALWSVKPLVQDGLPACSTDSGGNLDDCDWNMTFVNPASGLSLGKTPRWVIVTGHFDDPVAETCRYTSGGPFGDQIPPAVYARQACRSEFVVTGVQNTVAPG